jgi:nucleoside-diphosphate-sugar epimerase
MVKMMPYKPCKDTRIAKNRKSVAIIGGTGFIGTNLTARLTASDDVIIIDKKIGNDFPSITRVADVRNIETLRLTVPEGSVMVNLAAEHRDDVTPRSLYEEVNVEGARNLCLVAREKSIQTIVFTSTVAVYGFAPVGTDEAGTIAPFSDYGRTKFEAEIIFRAWQAEEPEVRRLVIVRPTVVFGERNRGNVYNLFRQIASGMFIMVGAGTNRKSLAYVDNVAAFLEQCMQGDAGTWTFNYIDKPDMDMNTLVAIVLEALGKPAIGWLRLPKFVALGLGHLFDLTAKISGRKFAISAIRVKKFTANSVYGTAVTPAMFSPPVSLDVAISRTIAFEFVNDNSAQTTFDSE